jgi:hypothetical protein
MVEVGSPTPMPIPPVDGLLPAGTYVSDLDGTGPYPRVVMDLPSGWSGFKGQWVNKNLGGPGFAGLTFWNVDEVYADGCHWQRPRLAPGRGVDELASVLAHRPLRNATGPVDVTLAGYNGKYMVWSVPDDIDFADCDVDPGDGVHYFESWTASIVGGDRYQQGPGQEDELWILDINGQRLVIDATHMPGTSMADVAELHSIMRTIRFE